MRKTAGSVRVTVRGGKNLKRVQKKVFGEMSPFCKLVLGDDAPHLYPAAIKGGTIPSWDDKVQSRLPCSSCEH